MSVILQRYVFPLHHTQRCDFGDTHPEAGEALDAHLLLELLRLLCDGVKLRINTYKAVVNTKGQRY